MLACACVRKGCTSALALKWSGCRGLHILSVAQSAAVERQRLEVENQKRLSSLKETQKSDEETLKGIKDEISRLEAEKSARDARYSAASEQLDRLRKEKDGYENGSASIAQQIAQLQVCGASPACTQDDANLFDP